jgi:hypothetical protein
MTRAQHSQLNDLVRNLRRAPEIVLDLEVRCNAFGDHDIATGFALRAIDDAWSFLFDLREGRIR